MSPLSATSHHTESHSIVSDCIESRFEVTRYLARGGMGEIYLTRDLQTGQPAAVKVARDDVDDEFGDRFEHEIEVTRRVHHPLVPAQIADGRWGDRRFVAFEYVDGRSVADLLDGLGRRLPMGLALTIAIDVLETLSVVHATTADDGAPLDLVHRDVTPQNLIVDRCGRTHLIDFGISTDRQHAIGRGVVMGKAGYLAPEQLAGVEVDGATDQFALGIVLWEILTDTALSANQFIANVVQLPNACDVPASIVQIVQRLLAADRAARFPSCADAAIALRGARLNLPLSERDYDIAALFGESEPAECSPTVVERRGTVVLEEPNERGAEPEQV